MRLALLPYNISKQEATGCILVAVKVFRTSCAIAVCRARLYSCILLEYNRQIRIRSEYDKIRVEYSILGNTEEYKRNTRRIHRIPY